MLSKHKLTMSWGDRFAVIDHFAPTDSEVCATFGVTQDELDTARSLRDAGTFAATPNLDVIKFSNVFVTSNLLSTQSTRGTTHMNATAKSPTVTAHSVTEASAIPETASKPAKQSKKRGRKGDKIQKALYSVPNIPMPVDVFIQQSGVSLAVLQQANTRFTAKLTPSQAQIVGKINVRQDKATKKLMIWREDI